MSSMELSRAPLLPSPHSPAGPCLFVQSRLSLPCSPALQASSRTCHAFRSVADCMGRLHLLLSCQGRGLNKCQIGLSARETPKTSPPCKIPRRETDPEPATEEGRPLMAGPFFALALLMSRKGPATWPPSPPSGPDSELCSYVPSS